MPLRDGAGNPWWACSERLRRLPGVRRSRCASSTWSPRGEPIPVDLTASFLRDGAGRVIQAVCVLRDASVRSRGDSQRGELISTLAHELRSPLTSVKGFTSTLLHRWERFTDEQKREMLATVNMDADRVTRLIRELLDVSRIDAGRLELRRKEFDLPAMAEGIVGRFELQHDGHKFHLSFPDGFPRVYADPDKIEQVLTNLVENAVKYSDGGAVTVTGQVTDTEVEVAVGDQGVGIPADQLPDLHQVLPAGRARVAQRHRARPVHRPRPGRGPRRPHLGRLVARPGQHPAISPAPRGPGAGRHHLARHPAQAGRPRSGRDVFCACSRKEPDHANPRP